jgi:hypothetical protein
MVHATGGSHDAESETTCKYNVYYTAIIESVTYMLGMRVSRGLDAEIPQEGAVRIGEPGGENGIGR